MARFSRSCLLWLSALAACGPKEAPVEVVAEQQPSPEEPPPGEPPKDAVPPEPPPAPVFEGVQAAFKERPEIKREHKSGLVVEDYALGEGPPAVYGATLAVRYATYLSDGTLIHENRGQGKAPFRFELGERAGVRGWSRGLLGLRQGGKRKIIVPPALAYGARGAPGDVGLPSIPPHATLVYFVELQTLQLPPKPPVGPEAFQGRPVASERRAHGLRIRDFRLGQGAAARKGDRVTVHFRGRLEDGKVFDSSAMLGHPLRMVLGSPQMIQGWSEGLVGMKEGGLREIVVPPKLGYGKRGGPGLPAKAKLFFELELVKLEQASARSAGEKKASK